MSHTVEAKGIQVMRYWAGEEARYEVYKGQSALSNLRREDVQELAELLQQILAEERDEKPAKERP